MAWAKKSGQTDHRQEEPLAPARPHPQLADEGAAGRPSPARGLQRRLDDAYGTVDGKWSARRTLLFILATCGGFWALVFMLVGSLKR